MTQEKNVHKSNFSVRLEKIMFQRGLSQHALASLTHTTQSTVRGWLNNAMPRARTLDDLANALSVNVQWLKTGDGETDRTISSLSEDPTAYKFTPRGPSPTNDDAKVLHNGCMLMLNAMPQAKTAYAFDYAAMIFEETWRKFKAAKYNELNQIPP